MHHPRPHHLYADIPQEHEHHFPPIHHPPQHTPPHHDHISGNSEPISSAIPGHHQHNHHNIHPQHIQLDHWEHPEHHHPHVHHHNECRDYVTIIAYADIIVSQFEMALCIYLLVKTIGFTIHSHEDMPRILHVLTATAVVQLFMCIGGTYLALRLSRATKPMTPHADAVKICQSWQIFTCVQIVFELVVVVISNISLEFAIAAGNAGFLFILDRIFGLVVVHRYLLQLDHITKTIEQAPVNPGAVREPVLNNSDGSS